MNRIAAVFVANLVLIYLGSVAGMTIYSAMQGNSLDPTGWAMMMPFIWPPIVVAAVLVTIAAETDWFRSIRGGLGV